MTTDSILRKTGMGENVLLDAMRKLLEDDVNVHLMTLLLILVSHEQHYTFLMGLSLFLDHDWV